MRQLVDLENTINSTIARSGNASYEVLYKKNPGEASGTLTKSIDDYDMIIVMHSEPGPGVYTGILDPEHGGIGFNFSTGSNYIYGNISFSDNTFNVNITQHNISGWVDMCRVIEVIGVKF